MAQVVLDQGAALADLTVADVAALAGTARHLWQIVTKDGRQVYDNQVTYSFGDTIPIGELRIDTSDLPLYDDAGRS